MTSHYMQLRRGFCKLGYYSRLAALFFTVRGKSNTFSRWFSLFALLEPQDYFDMLKKPVQWVQEIFFEVRLRFHSRPHMVVCWLNMEVFNISSSSRGQLYVIVLVWCDEFKPLRAFAMPATPISACNFSAMLDAGQIHANTWNLASLEIYALVLRAL